MVRVLVTGDHQLLERGVIHFSFQTLFGDTESGVLSFAHYILCLD